MRTYSDIHAYHEAGHAVANWLGGIQLDFVSIDTTNGGPPVTCLNGNYLRKLSPDLWQQQSVLVAWAGYAADLTHLRSIVPDASASDVTGYDKDQQMGRSILIAMGLPTKMEEFYRDEILRLFKEPSIWCFAERLAEKLKTQPTVLRDEFENLMAELPCLTGEFFAGLAIRRKNWWDKFRG